MHRMHDQASTTHVKENPRDPQPYLTISLSPALNSTLSILPFPGDCGASGEGPPALGKLSEAGGIWVQDAADMKGEVRFCLVCLVAVP